MRNTIKDSTIKDSTIEGKEEDFRMQDEEQDRKIVNEDEDEVSRTSHRGYHKLGPANFCLVTDLP